MSGQVFFSCLFKVISHTSHYVPCTVNSNDYTVGNSLVTQSLKAGVVLLGIGTDLSEAAEICEIANSAVQLHPVATSDAIN